MSMPADILASRDGSERARLRRCIQILGPAKVAQQLQRNRATVCGYAAGAEVTLGTETLIVLGLPDVEAEANAEAERRRTG